MRILIVDDSSSSLRILRRHLIAMDHEVCMAVDGIEAWSLLRHDRFPLVISDWMMPGLDGPSLCQKLRDIESDFYTYFLLLTGRTGLGDRVQALQAGADDFLNKPVDVSELSVRLEIACRILKVHESLRKQNERLATLATIDGLTGLKNRREFQRTADTAFAIANRQRLPLSLIMIDVDNFKAFNDTYGHPSGDQILRGISTILMENCREHETASRYGGEEFAIILLGTTAMEARMTAERLREAIASQPWPYRQVTASFGIATASGATTCPRELIEQADQALYHSKTKGRNRVTHADDALMTIKKGDIANIVPIREFQ